MKYFNLLLISLFISSCSNLEFVYKTNDSSLKIKNSTYLFIEGNESNEIYSYITSKLGASRNIDYQYKLLIKSKKNELAEVIEKDATASKFSIDSHRITYEGNIGFGNHLTFNLGGKGDLLKDIQLLSIFIKGRSVSSPNSVDLKSN